jgi:ABC-2 type transport system permease protein
MFFHQYKYRIKFFLHTPTILFWALIFPMLLGTLFQSTFGSTNSQAEGFKTIPVAVITDSTASNATEFLEKMKELSYQNDNKMFELKETTYEEAQKLLYDEEIYGIILNSTTRELVVAESGFEVSVIKQFLDEYLRVESYIKDVMAIYPDRIMQADTIQNSESFIKTVSLKGNDIDATLQYYYALIAMVCLFGSYLGLANARDIQANLSANAARRCVSASRKTNLVCADSLAALTIHFSELVIVWVYLKFVLGVNIGEQPLAYFAVCLVGSIIGITFGQFIGIACRGSEAAKEGILTSVSLSMSFLSGLMFGNMQDVVRKNMPIINDINPAALITDAFYSLTVFDDYSRYFKSLISLIIISAILLTGSILLVRREKYESI